MISLSFSFSSSSGFGRFAPARLSSCFRVLSFEILRVWNLGESDLGSMDPDALERVNSELVVGIMGSEFPRSQEDARDGDDLISEFYDPHLYYGEVDREES